MSHLRMRLLTLATISVAGLAAVAGGLRAQGTAVIRGPYLQSGTPSSVVIRWRTADATDSVVRYGASPGALTAIASVPGLRTDHVVTLTALAPHTRYFYAVGSSAATLAGADLDHAFTTSPPPGSRTPLRLWVLGDAGTADATARAVRDAYYARPPEAGTQLALLLGDNAYPEGTDAQYQAAVFDTFGAVLRQSVLWPTFGNHDAISADAATGSGPYFDIFSLPAAGEAGGIPSGTEAYYSFDYANVHFICLDSSESDRSPTGAMATWLSADLAASEADWTVAFFHHAPYSRGTHDSDVDTGMREMREYIVPVLEAGGVDLVLAGHSHNYERSMLISGHYGPAATFSPAHVVDGGSGDEGGYQKIRGMPAGAVYVLAGSAGAAGPGPLNHPAMRAAFATSGSLAIDVDGGRLQAFYLRDTGVVQDAFTLLKQEPTGPPAAPWGVRTEEFSDPHYLRWTPADGGGRVDGYRVEAGTAPGRSDIGVLTVGTQPFLAFGGGNGRYFVRVRAFNAAGISPPSEEISVTIGGWNHEIQPPPPSGVIAAAVAGSLVQLSWPVGGYDGQSRVEVGSRPGQADLAAFWAGSTVAGTVPAGVYYVRFRRVSLGGMSEPSLDTQVVVGSVPAPPDRPGVIRSAVSGRTVTMTWAPPAGTRPVQHYVIEAGLTPRTTLLRLATPDARPQYAVPDVPPGTYYVRVRAANAVGEGVASADARVMVR